jgi:hypothetical protein
MKKFKNENLHKILKKTSLLKGVPRAIYTKSLRKNPEPSDVSEEKGEADVLAVRVNLTAQVHQAADSVHLPASEEHTFKHFKDNLRRIGNMLSLKSHVGRKGSTTPSLL